MVKWSKFLPVLGLIVLAILLLTTDLGELWNSFKGQNPLYFLLSLLLAIPSILVKSFKWNLIAKEFNAKKLSIKNTLTYWLAGFAFGTVTPGNLGDFYRGFYLKKHNVTSINSFMTVLIDRVIDIALLFCAGLIGLFVLTIKFFPELAPLLKTLTVILFAVAFVGVVFMKKNAAKMILKPIYRFLVPEKYKKDLKFNFHSFYDDFNLFRKKYFSVSTIVLLTAVCWFIVIIQYFALVLGAGLSISFFEVMLFIPLVILLEALPISFNRAGPKEAGLVFFLALFGIPAHQAISIGFSMVAVNLIITAVGGMVLIKKPAQI